MNIEMDNVLSLALEKGTVPKRKIVNLQLD